MISLTTPNDLSHLDQDLEDARDDHNITEALRKTGEVRSRKVGR